MRLLGFLGAILLFEAAFPCTIFVVSRGGQIFAAGNEDDDNKPELSQHTIRFVPANKEKGTLGFVAFGYANNPFSDESAMNEAGLFYDFDALDRKDVPRAGKPQGKFNAVNEMLTKCRTVKEAVKFLESVDLPYMSSAQIVIGDASGASAIVDRSATTWRLRGKDYQIGTNFRTSDTPAEKITCERYKLCDAALRQKKHVNLESVTDLLKGTKAAEGSESKDLVFACLRLEASGSQPLLRGRLLAHNNVLAIRGIEEGPTQSQHGAIRCGHNPPSSRRLPRTTLRVRVKSAEKMDQERVRQLLNRAGEIQRQSEVDLELHPETLELVEAAAETGLSRDAVLQALRERISLFEKSIEEGQVVFAPSADGNFYAAIVKEVQANVLRIQFMSGGLTSVDRESVKPFVGLPGQQIYCPWPDWGWWKCTIVSYDSQNQKLLVSDGWTSQMNFHLSDVRLNAERPPAHGLLARFTPDMIAVAAISSGLGALLTWLITR